jgi:hypothetical protein
MSDGDIDIVDIAFAIGIALLVLSMFLRVAWTILTGQA